MLRDRGAMFARLIVSASLLVIGFSGIAAAADAAPPRRMPVKAAPPPVPIDPWTIRFSSYFWAPSLNGSSTVKGRTTDVDVSFVQLLEHTQIPKDLFGMMNYVEARGGQWSLFADVVYMMVGASASGTRSRAFSPNVAGTVGASLGLKFRMAIAEAGAAYEIARWGGFPGTYANAGSFTALDVVGGARFWWQKADLDFNLAGTLVAPDLRIDNGRAVAASGDIWWIDPLVGLRLRHQFTPGHELTLLGDIGGFTLGSRFSWQAVGAYSFDLMRTANGVTWGGLIGYRALYADYRRDTVSGLTNYEFDMLMHGPILGITGRF